MNIGNLINQKLIESQYENKKELYEAMKAIVGDSCCAYNTFTEALSKNKSISDVELLAISTLLNIDLNKLALHYVNSIPSFIRTINIDEYIEDYKEELLLYISYIMGNDYNNNTFSQYILSSINNKAYFLYFNEASDFVICYEFLVSIDTNYNYLLKTNEIARFNLFSTILGSNNLDKSSFISMELKDKINLLKNEGKMYYELFPDNKKNIEDIVLYDFIKDFINEFIKNTFLKYIEDNSDSLIRTERDEIMLDPFTKISEKQLKAILEDELETKKLYADSIKYNDSLFHIFKKEALKILPITTDNELEAIVND